MLHFMGGRSQAPESRKVPLRLLPHCAPYRCCTGRALVTQTGWLWTGWVVTYTGVTKAETPLRCPSSMEPIGQCWSALASVSPGLWWWTCRMGE